MHHWVSRVAVMVVIAVWLVGVSAAPRLSSPGEFAVTLRYEAEIALPQTAAEQLYLKAMEVLESSNFNSHAPQWEWNLSVLLDEYRQAVSGNYLLITFALPQQVKTVGGVISVRELLIGLNGEQYASSLHTIDDEQRIVGHAKYSGELCVDLLNLVKKLVATPSNALEQTREGSSASIQFVSSSR